LQDCRESKNPGGKAGKTVREAASAQLMMEIDVKPVSYTEIVSRKGRCPLDKRKRNYKKKGVKEKGGKGWGVKRANNIAMRATA